MPNDTLYPTDSPNPEHIAHNLSLMQHKVRLAKMELDSAKWALTDIEYRSIETLAQFQMYSMLKINYAELYKNIERRKQTNNTTK